MITRYADVKILWCPVVELEAAVERLVAAMDPPTLIIMPLDLISDIDPPASRDIAGGHLEAAAGAAPVGVST